MHNFLYLNKRILVVLVIYKENTSNIFLLQSAVETGVNKLFTREGYLFLMEKSKYIKNLNIQINECNK